MAGPELLRQPATKWVTVPNAGSVAAALNGLTPETWLVSGFVVQAALILILLLRRVPGVRMEAEATRAAVADAERALRTSLATLSTTMIRDQAESRLDLEIRLRDQDAVAAARHAALTQSVNENLQQAVENQMQGSFQRVIDQFSQVQRALGDVQAMTTQIGDLKRLFGNVKARGTWGEVHLRALLEDVLPHGGWEQDRKLREDSHEVVEFAIAMPVKGTHRPWLALDAKFPTADYDRILQAAEAGDLDAERQARSALGAVLRAEARKIGMKYINPPITVDFAVMYLPTDGLYVEAARMPGLLEEMNREHRVLIMGPSLAPALLRTIQLGMLTLSLEEKSEDIQRLLGATRTEMSRMDETLTRLARQASAFSNTIDDVRTRTRAVGRKLRGVVALDEAEAAAMLSLKTEDPEITEGPGHRPGPSHCSTEDPPDGWG